MMMMMVNQTPYWPEPAPTVVSPSPLLPSHQQFVDPHYFQNLMIKLAGDDNQKLNPSDFDLVSLDHHHQLYDNNSSMSSMLASPTSMNSGGSQQHVLIGQSSSVSNNSNMFQGLENFTVDGMPVYGNQVMEGLYGMEMAVNGGGAAAASSSVESSSWGDINSLVNYPTMVSSEYEANNNCQQNVPQRSVFDDDETRYFRQQ